MLKHFQRGNGHDVVAVHQCSGFITKQDAISVAVVRDNKVGPEFLHMLAQVLGVHRAAILIDVVALGLVAKDEDFRPQFTQHAGRGLVSRAMSAIHHDPQSFERQSTRETGFGVFDVATERVINTHRLANLIR